MVRKEKKSTGCYDVNVKLDTPPAEILSLIPDPTAASEMEICSFAPSIAGQIPSILRTLRLDSLILIRIFSNKKKSPYTLDVTYRAKPLCL